MNTIEPCDFYLLRAPFLPIEKLLTFNQRYKSEEEIDLIKEFFNDPRVLEALYVASPDLHKEYTNLHAGKVQDIKKKHRLVKSLYKYLTRMTTRPTPYGLFAGCSSGEIKQKTEILLQQDHIRKHKRIDMTYVAELVGHFNKLPALRDQLNYFPNNSAYFTGDKLRYTEHITHNKHRAYRLAAVDNNEYIRLILQASKNGATPHQLCQALLVYDNSLEEAEAKEFIETLIANQLLISELEPPITGEEFFPLLIDKLKRLGVPGSVVEVLASIQEILSREEPSVRDYDRICELMNAILPGTTSKDLIQVDMFFTPQSNCIGKTWMNTFSNQLEQLFRLSNKYIIEDIEEFKKKFQERYEQTEVSLMEALDPELGIGYAEYIPGKTDINPLSDKLSIKRKNDPEIKWTNLMRYKLSKYMEAIHHKKTEIIIEDSDIDRLSKGKKITLPDQFYAMGSMIKGGFNEHFDFVLHNLMGPSACDIMGRFCHGDRKLQQHVRQLFDKEKEKYPDIIFAEVVHLPPQRIGNILLRPVLRDFEIPFLGQSSVPGDHQLPVHDLLVSIVNNEIVLRSRKFNKRVIPKLTSAHNYSTGNLSVYKFLCDIQYQSLNMGFAWDWEVLASESYLPRVRYKNIILHKAQWLLKRADFEEYAPEGTIQAFQAYLKKLDIPRYVSVEEADNLLLIDTDNELSSEILLDTLYKKKNVIVSEFLQVPEDCIAGDGVDHFTNEFIFPFTSESRVFENSGVTPLHQGLNDATPRRSFCLGDEWLYYKIFCGTQSGERLLKEKIPLLTARLQEKSLIDKWFFVRYFDPEPHLRLRFHHPGKKKFWASVVEELQQELSAFIENGWINKIETGTYNREIERYSPLCIAESESLFYNDSEAVLKILQLIDKYEEQENYRWLAAFQGVDAWLSDFDLTIVEKLAFSKSLYENFFLEFGGSDSLRHHLNDQYRNDLKRIRHFIAGEEHLPRLNEQTMSVYKKRSVANAPGIENIRRALKKEPGNPVISDLLPSYVHMFCNRIFISNHRKNELVVYHYLYKFYQSEIAQSKHRTRLVKSSLINENS